MSGQAVLAGQGWRVGRYLDGLLRFCRHEPLGTLGLLVILLMLGAGILAPFIAPYDPLATDYVALAAPPSFQHLAGTDTFGRDILSRLVYGARTALIIGLASSFLGSTAGFVLGTASAYFGGRVDAVIQGVIGVVLSIPLIVMALVVIAVLGHAELFGVDFNLVLAIATPMVGLVARVIRNAALSVRTMPYVDAARAAGYGHMRIVLRHMAPNLFAPYVILLSSYVAQAILLEAALSFLGLGVTEPTPSWGLMLAGTTVSFFRTAPWTLLCPGLAITAAVFAFSMFGDALRDWLDPRMKV